MRFLVVLFMCFIAFMAKVTAHTDPSIQPVLRFNEGAIQNSRSFDPLFLKVVAEEVKFPNHPQKQRFEKALSIIEEVMNSDEFRMKVIAYVRANGKQEYSQNFLWKNSKAPLTNEEIYRVIMTGNEKMIENSFGEMNINSMVKVCKGFEIAGVWCRTVVGSTSPRSSKWIKLNWNFYNRYETHEMVENIVHEWLHLNGFLHGEDNLHEEVPYVVGEIAGQIAKKLLNE